MLKIRVKVGQNGEKTEFENCHDTFKRFCKTEITSKTFTPSDCENSYLRYEMNCTTDFDPNLVTCVAEIPYSGNVSYLDGYPVVHGSCPLRPDW